MKLKTIILAAGQGTRMRSSRPKVLHQLAGISLLEHVCQLADAVGGDAKTVVYGHGADQLLTQLDHLNVTWTEQAEQLGTGHAVMQTVDQIDDDDTVLILYGDVPLLRQPTVERLLQLVEKQTLALLTVVLDNPTGYGRIVRSAAGAVEKIVEQKDASVEQQAIDEINTGILALNGGHLKKWLGKLENSNAQGEYYLTDIIAMAVADGIAVNCTQPEDPNEVLGVNDRHQLAHLERCYQRWQAEQLMDQGVTLIDPARFDLRGVVTDVGQDVEIDINVILEGEVSLGDRVRIGANTIIKNSSIAADCEILPNSTIEDAVVGMGCRIGPYARLRPETRLDNDVHIGNFVELKKSVVAAGSKINHLSYIGDCSVGSGVNIGAGTITCNYDGVNKFQTTIKDDAFIGSNSQLVAPVTIGRGATIGAGSTITRNTPDEQLTLTRSKQQSIEGWKRPVKQKG